ncbi:MAG: alanine racemase [Alphaproteobacteria bacterium]|nr:alanine racemase [Alphaproteobacteria bacterium]
MPARYFETQPSGAEIQQKMAGYGGWFEIDLDALSANLAAITARTGVEVMPVIKNNAYGHGLRPICSALVQDGVKWLMVAKLSEALAISSWGMDCDVLNMDALYTEAQFDQVVEQGVTQVVYTSDLATRLNAAALAQGRAAGVFIKIDTGLHRVGVDHKNAIELITEIAAMPSLQIKGTFSTLMQDDSQDKVIFERFQAVLDQMAAAGIDPGFRSMASTHGIFHTPDGWLDMVRPAMCLFGIYPWEADRNSALKLEQVLTFKARIEELKPVPKGDTVTYFGAYTASRDMQVGTLHVGFFDALPRELANKGTILVGGKPCPTIGSISLNHCLFDATGADAKIGEVVEVIAKEGVNNLVTTAETAGWMVYSLLNHLNPFVPRVYYRGGVPVALHVVEP